MLMLISFPVSAPLPGAQGFDPDIFDPHLTPGSKPAAYPKAFNDFFAFIKAREGTDRAKESCNPDCYSQYGLLPSTVRKYIPLDTAYQKAINAGTLSEADAKAIYWIILNHKATSATDVSSLWPTITGDRAKTIYADMVVTLGMPDANALYEKANAYPVAQREQALEEIYLAALLGQTWVNDDAGEHAKSAESAAWAGESYLNRFDTINQYTRFGGVAQTEVRHMLRMDCRNQMMFDLLAEEWNVDPQFLAALNPNYTKTGQVRVPIVMRKLYGTDVYKGDDAALRKLIHTAYPAAGDAYKFVPHAGTPEKRYNVLLPVTGTVRNGVPTIRVGSSDAQPVTHNAVDTQTYVVSPGDTLFSIARDHGVTVSDLKAWNKLNSTTLKPNQVLKVSAQ